MGGVLVDLGSHVLDICLMLLGDRKPKSYELITSNCSEEKIQKTGAAKWFKSSDTSKMDMDVEDIAVVNVQFEERTELLVCLSWLAPIEADGTYFKVVGTRGAMELKTLFGFSKDRMWKEDIFDIQYRWNRERNTF